MRDHLQVISPLLIIFRVAQGKAWSQDTASAMRSSSSKVSSPPIILSETHFSPGAMHTSAMSDDSFPPGGDLKALDV